MLLLLITELIKKTFCNLVEIKSRGNNFEILTGYSTLNDKFISVFIHQLSDGKWIISDLGWLDQNYYDTPYYEESEEILNKIKNTFLINYKIKTTSDERGNIFYYKSTLNFEHISSLVYDLSNFLLGAANSYCIQFKDEKEEKERETFRKDANLFLKKNYEGNLRLKQSLDDFRNIKFNAIVYKGMNLNLISYVTGSSTTYFENDLRKSIVNFEISDRSSEKKFITNKISIINDQCEGFNLKKSDNLMNLLSEKLTAQPIFWSNREEILQIIE